MVYYKTTEQLMDLAKKKGIKTTDKGLLHFNTGKFTGRSPKDRYFSQGKYTDSVIDFERVINQKLKRDSFISLKNEIKEYFKTKDILHSRKVAGYSYEHMSSFNLLSTEPWALIFFNNMLIDPQSFVTTYSRSFTEWEILHAPDFVSKNKPDDVKNENFVIIDFDDRKILIAGTSYTGEIKKSIFTVMNTLLIDRGVLPMHCSANANTKVGRGVNLFFGLSGTGKTTLSSDVLKYFIGDDEHGWDGRNIFNFEGGCYAKLIDLEKEKEQNIFFLSFDAFGVLPPISLLDTEQAVEYFKLGYTSKVAGTEVGVNEPTSTFSPCFGGPFLPRKISDYTNIFRDKLKENESVKVWLVNTGFDKDYKRFSLSQTRGVINGVIERDYEDDYIEYNELKIPKRIGKYNMEKVFEKPDNNRQDKFFTMLKDSL